MKAYREGDCPNVEAYRKHLCLFKTGMQTLDKVNRELDALRAAIRHYA